MFKFYALLGFYNLLDFLKSTLGLIPSSDMTIEELLQKKVKAQGVKRIISSDKQFSKEQINQFFSLDLTDLHTLNFWNQVNVNDDTLRLIAKKASEGQSFRRLNNLDLTGTRITEQGIQALLNSKEVGSVRDFSQLITCENKPVTMLHIRVENVDAEFPNEEQFNQGDIFEEVTITYKVVTSYKETFTSKEGIKLIELSNE